MTTMLSLSRLEATEAIGVEVVHGESLTNK